MYTIQQVARIAGISTRTLRYYDRIGLFQPTERSDSNYRLYAEEDLLQLQQILLYKEMKLSLSQIKEILHAPTFQIVASLQDHLSYIVTRQQQLKKLELTIKRTIQQLQGGHTMKHDDLFKGLKEQAIEDNENTYGKELRDTYGEQVVNDSYQRMRKMSKWQWKRAEELGQEILDSLPYAMTKGVDSKEAHTLCNMHQEWIQLYWMEYSKEAHIGLCKMYTEDERFTAYYDAVKPGAAKFLYEAMKRYLN